MAEKKTIVAFAILIILVWIFAPGFFKFKELSQKNKELERKIQELKISNTGLIEETERLQHDLVYIEKVARERLSVAKEGEIIYKILSEEESPRD